MPEERNKKKEYRIKINKEPLSFTGLIILAGIIIVFLINILGLVLPDKDFSERENRSMSTRPNLSIDSLKNGKYFSDTESYLQDQFPARGVMVSIKSRLEQVLGTRELNGVYIGKKGFLIEDAMEPDPVWFEKNLKAIKEFSESYEGINIYMSVIPNACYILEDYLPGGAPVASQGDILTTIKNGIGEKVKFIDVTDTFLEHKDEGLYYKSDHHWTSLGAKYAFDTIAPEIGLQDYASDYTVYPVSENFRGTMSSKSGVRGRKDVVEIYIPKYDNNEYLVTYPDTHEESLSMYKSSALDTKDKYTVFFGGNYPLVDIKTTNQNRRCLLVIKDSYANCFMQFLIPYYEHIIMVDPRYYYENIDSLISSEVVTDVLFLYNVNTYVEDKSLADTLELE